MDERYVTCACFTEALHLVYDEDSRELFVSIYAQAGARPSWRHRLSSIWRILTTGHPYDDEIILDRSSLHALTTWLQEHDDVS